MKRKDEIKELELKALHVLSDGNWHIASEIISKTYKIVSAQRALKRYDHWFKRPHNLRSLAEKIDRGKCCCILTLLQDFTNKNRKGYTIVGTGVGKDRKHKITQVGKDYYAKISGKNGGSK